jgi:hypothetical protein
MRRESDLQNLPILIIKGVVTIAENSEDPYCHISMEILRELGKIIISLKNSQL